MSDKSSGSDLAAKTALATAAALMTAWMLNDHRPAADIAASACLVSGIKELGDLVRGFYRDPEASPHISLHFSM